MEIKHWLDGHNNEEENRVAAIELCQEFAKDFQLTEIPDWAIDAVISAFYQGWQS